MTSGTSSVFRAKATIKVLYGINPDCWITSELLSPGLWGIESDSSECYREQVYQEERDTLLTLLASLKTYEIRA
jgi:hypothetical protein